MYRTHLFYVVNECLAGRSALVFHDYFSVHDSEYDVRNVGWLNIPRVRTEEMWHKRDREMESTNKITNKYLYEYISENESLNSL